MTHTPVLARITAAQALFQDFDDPGPAPPACLEPEEPRASAEPDVTPAPPATLPAHAEWRPPMPPADPAIARQALEAELCHALIDALAEFRGSVAEDLEMLARATCFLIKAIAESLLGSADQGLAVPGLSQAIARLSGEFTRERPLQVVSHPDSAETLRDLLAKEEFALDQIVTATSPDIPPGQVAFTWTCGRALWNPQVLRAAIERIFTDFGLIGAQAARS